MDGILKISVWNWIAFFMILSVCSCGDNPARDRISVEKHLNKWIDRCQKDFPNVKDIPVQEALRLQKKGQAILIDVREKREREVSMIKGAISLKKFESQLNDWKDKLCIPYCTIGYRSSKVTETLKTKGFKTRNLRGSILAWAHEGLPLVKDGKEIKKVHVYSKEWDFLDEEFETVW